MTWTGGEDSNCGSWIVSKEEGGPWPDHGYVALQAALLLLLGLWVQPAAPQPPHHVAAAAGVIEPSGSSVPGGGASCQQAQHFASCRR
jgi:hypothetical protein